METLTRIDTSAPAVLLPYSVQPSPGELQPGPHFVPVADASALVLPAEWLAGDPVIWPALCAELQALSESDDGQPLLTSWIGFGDLSAMLGGVPDSENKTKLQHAMSAWGGFAPDLVFVDFRKK
jgi:hypothetical protein